MKTPGTINTHVADTVPSEQSFVQSPSHTKRTEYTVVSMFAGAGGLDLGLTGGFTYKGVSFPRLPFRIIEAYDSDSKCVETYRKNIGDHIKKRDLSTLPAKKIPQAEILIGGFPCQDFSSCGPKRGITTSRGQLYKALIRYMEEHSPKLVLAENVPHIARMRNGKILDTIVKEMEAVGYNFEVWDLFAPDYGIPQNRRRIFLVGLNKNINGTVTPPKASFKNKHRSIEWAICDLEDIVDESVPNQSQYFKASRAKNGNGQGDETSIREKPGYTVRANAKSRVQFHYSLDRRLTVRELARLQTFPDEFVLPHSATANVMQIGNAVPPMLAYKVAKRISSFLSNLPQYG